MADVEVAPESLRESAKAASEAGQQVRALGLDIVKDLATALVGSRAGGKAGALGEHWERDTETWAGKMDGYGEKLLAAATRYESDDEAGEQVFGGTGG